MSPPPACSRCPAAFLAPAPLLSRQPLLRSSTCRRRAVPVASSADAEPDGQPVPDSPASLVRSWKDTRTIASTIDLSRRFVSVLLLSNHCHRALVAEKVLAKYAEQYSLSRRLLILSAGLESQPGDLLPLNLVSSARTHNIDLQDERPCASFQITDLDCYDFVIVLDRNVKDKLIHMAEASAHSMGGPLHEWERKIRVLCDFDGSIGAQSPGRRGVQHLDVPSFDASSDFLYTLEIIAAGCEQVICSLIAAGVGASV